ncbi:MAG: thioredoxin [Deltaproteobacteria bacterium]|nr:thioredoxin [Deltaproteobacteria bacterium]
MATVVLDRNNFEQVVLESDIAIVDFWAPWCGPCKTFAPVFEGASQAHTDVVFGKVDTDEEQELARAFEVRSIPTLMIFREKILVFAQAGALTAPVLDDVLRKVKALDMDDVRSKVQAALDGAAEQD